MIGAGDISDYHANGYKESENARIMAYCDLKIELAEQKAKKFGAVSFYDSVDKLLKDPRVEAVDIAVPNKFHSEIAVKACESGKHVMLEKPMAKNVEECNAIIRAAQKAGVNLMIDHSLMFFPPFAHCKKLLDDGKIGKIIRTRAVHMGYRYFGWRADPEITGGGVLIEGCVHPIYLSQWFLGPLVEVSAMIGKSDPEIQSEDIVMILLKGKEGGFGVIDSNLGGPFPLWDDHLELVGSEGMIIANGAEQQILRGPPLLHFRDGTWTAYRERTFSDPRFPEFPNEIEWNWSKVFVYSTREFVSSIRENRKPRVTGEDGRRIIEIVEACYKSARTGQSVNIA